MAKRARRKSTKTPQLEKTQAPPPRRRSGATQGADPGAQRLIGFAEDIGRLLGAAEAKASTWLAQRDDIGKQLVGMRDSIDELLGRIGFAAHGRQPRTAGRGPRAAGQPGDASPSSRRRRKRRRVSAEARKRMSEAAKKRWAERRKQGT